MITASTVHRRALRKPIMHCTVLWPHTVTFCSGAHLLITKKIRICKKVFTASVALSAHLNVTKKPITDCTRL